MQRARSALSPVAASISFRMRCIASRPELPILPISIMGTLADPMAASIGADAVPLTVKDGQHETIFARGPVGQLTHRIKPALGEGPPAFVADRGKERLLDAVLAGGLHPQAPKGRQRHHGQDLIEASEPVFGMAIGSRPPVLD